MHLKVNPDDLVSAAQALSVTAQRIDGRLDQLAAGSRVLRSQWIGDASNAFGARSTALDADARQHVVNLRSTAETVHRIAGEYQQADNDGARAVIGL